MRHKLKEIRRRSDLTQIELAQKSGVPRSRIQLAEAGTVNLRDEELRAIEVAVRPGLERTAELLSTGLNNLHVSKRGLSISQRDSNQDEGTTGE